MKKLVNIFREWTIIELVLLASTLILIIGSGILYKSSWITIIASLSGTLYALYQARGKVLAQFIGIIEVILYSYLSYTNKYYGEVLLYVLLVLPLNITGIFSWIKNKSDITKKVIQSELKRREWLILGIGSVVLFFIIYLLLRYFNTSELLVSTFSLVIYLIATYLVVRRSKYGFLFYILSDIILIILWSIPIFKGDLLLIPILFEPLILLFNDTYGWISWSKENKNEHFL
jgi:nicotinamide mononucleotide transporter